MKEARTSKITKHDKELVEAALSSMRRGVLDEFKALLPSLMDRGLVAHPKVCAGDYTLLNAALSVPYRMEEAAKLLIENGADVGAVDFRSRTPLMKSAAFSVGVTQRLIQEKVDVNARDTYGATALHVAASSLSADNVILLNLINAGADVNALDNEGKTPLHKAVACSASKVELLLLNGADPTIAGRGEIGTPLDWLKYSTRLSETEKRECQELLERSHAS